MKVAPKTIEPPSGFRRRSFQGANNEVIDIKIVEE